MRCIITGLNWDVTKYVWSSSDRNYCVKGWCAGVQSYVMYTELFCDSGTVQVCNPMSCMCNYSVTVVLRRCANRCHVWIPYYKRMFHIKGLEAKSHINI